MKFFKLAFAALSAFFSSVAMAASVGFYAGTFDPPTHAQIRILRCALGDARLPKECQEIAKEISRLVVSVNEDSEKDSLASTRERALMLKKALQNYGDRVEIVASTPAKREERRRALLEDKNIERLFHFVGAESYRDGKSLPATQDPRLVWVVFPLEKESSPVKIGAAEAGLAESGVKQVVEKLGLYQDVSEDLADLQKSLFEEGWKDFLADLSSACPNTINRNECAELSSHWKDISLVTEYQIKRMDPKESSTKIQLIYKKSQSEDRWAEKFVTTALNFLEGSESYDKFKPVAEDIAARIFQGYPYGKLPHLRRVSLQKRNSPIGSLKVSQKRLDCSAPQGPYNMDIDQYIADRFPKAFSGFLKNELRRRSISPIDLYVHNHSVEEAYEFHRRDRFGTFYFLQTRRGQLHRNIYLAVKSSPLAYRVVLTNVRGHDRQANVLCQTHRAGVFSNYQSVQSRRALPFFVFNSLGLSLQLNENDWLLFGFRGSWRKKLLAEDWQQIPLVREGLDLDLFTHPTIKQKIVAARNVYGDDAEIVLDTFYKKGGRQVIYLGTAGAIEDYQIGDVVIPNEFVDRHNNSVPFQKNLARAYQSELANLLTTYTDKKQGWVQSLFEETKAVLLDWRAKSVVTVDIEGLHLARFARQHKDLKIAAFFVISDQTLGEITIEETNAYRGLIDASVDKLVSFLLPKVLTPN